MVVWENNWYIVGPLVALSLGHWSLLLHGVLVTAKWVPGQGCAIVSTNNKLLAATFIYTMCFDLVVLLLTASKLVRSSAPRSRLVNMIFADGLYYFIISYVFRSIPSGRSQRIIDAVSPNSFLGHLIATVRNFIQLDLPSLNIPPA